VSVVTERPEPESERPPEPEPSPRPRTSPPPTPGRAPSLIDSFNYAFEGIIHVLRTQRNLRIHFAIAIGVIVAAVWIGVQRMELIALLLAIAFVLVAEMINSAIEGAIDASTTSFDPNAKLAKDIAAGAVLIASVTALGIGYLVFSQAAAHRTARLLDRVRDAPAEITLVALVLVILIVIATKAWTGRGTPLRGGLPSGHAAIAFAGWMAVVNIVGGHHRFLIASVVLLMAVLVAQTRVEAGIHSTLEVVYGGVLGAAVTLLLFQVFK
jgi:diacylglycerol kinase (ATP)